MRGYLLDENLPGTLRLPSDLPTVSARTLGPSSTDASLWAHAKSEDLAIVTKDGDFAHRVAVSDPPPRVVLLRIGNARWRELIDRTRAAWPEVEALLRDHRLVTIHRASVVGFG